MKIVIYARPPLRKQTTIFTTDGLKIPTNFPDTSPVKKTLSVYTQSRGRRRAAPRRGQAAQSNGSKAANKMAWVGAMNNIKACAEEIILKEIVYA